MFESLSEKLNQTFNKLKGRGTLNEKNIEDALKEVRLALLEADVNYKVVKKFIQDIHERALGEGVLRSLTPGQQVIKIVNEELTRVMGAARQDLDLSGKHLFGLCWWDFKDPEKRQQQESWPCTFAIREEALILSLLIFTDPPR